MNIFAIHSNPFISGSYLVDKHIVKMPLETAQMLCSTHTLVNSGIKAPYLPSHLKHPCNLWLTESEENYDWLIYHGISLCFEYSERYGRVHSCLQVILWAEENRPKLPKKSITPFAIAMPDVYKISDNPVECYREYYAKGKKHLHAWKNNRKPDFVCF
jgi:hypothetical protein